MVTSETPRTTPGDAPHSPQDHHGQVTSPQAQDGKTQEDCGHRPRRRSERQKNEKPGMGREKTNTRNLERTGWPERRGSEDRLVILRGAW